VGTGFRKKIMLKQRDPENAMLTRRLLLVASVVLALSPAALAQAQDWKAKYPELVFAVIPAENAAGVTDRFGPFLAYLSKQLGTRVTLRVANDYAAVIEGQRSGNIQIGYYGPASFARARLTGVQTDAFAIDVNGDGSKGYYSVFYVLSRSPYQKIEDLKGKNLGVVDPNSTSGNNMPRFVLNQKGINPNTFFHKVQYTGSHENGIFALAQGTVDVAVNWLNSPSDSNLTRMLNKHMLKHPDGSEMAADDFRIILTSPLIINSPTAYLSSLPPDLKAAIRRAFYDAATNDKQAFDKLSDGRNQAYAPIENKDYDATIELIKFVDSLKKS
jgi:phosphonate transport system substrate-binding protein